MAGQPSPDYRPGWYQSFQYLMTAVRVYFFILIGAFVYLLADGSLDSWWKSEEEAVASASLSSSIDKVTEEELVENGIHVATGLVYAEGFELVRANCTACHSAKLLTQNRATRAGWKSMIEWMQATQGLWELGEQEARILDYLATYYAPEETGRRAPLEVTELEWYMLEL